MTADLDIVFDYLITKAAPGFIQYWLWSKQDWKYIKPFVKYMHGYDDERANRRSNMLEPDFCLRYKPTIILFATRILFKTWESRCGQSTFLLSR